MDIAVSTGVGTGSAGDADGDVGIVKTRRKVCSAGHLFVAQPSYAVLVEDHVHVKLIAGLPR